MECDVRVRGDPGVQVGTVRQVRLPTDASVEGIEGCEGGSAYNASKGAVVLLTRNMAIDWPNSPEK